MKLTAALNLESAYSLVLWHKLYEIVGAIQNGNIFGAKSFTL